VLNQCYRGNPLKLSAAHGKAWPVNSANTKLKVQFFWPFRGDYWILYIDPAYKTVLVGSPKYNYLWILSRTPTISDEAYQKIVNIAASRGYDIHKLVKTKQGCA
jgi:apolipoprotein D and lipocalin family protein